MNNKITVGVLSIAIGLIAGYVLFSPEKIISESPMNMEMEDHNSAVMEHSHAMLEVDLSKPLPSVTVEALKDTKDGYNLHILTTNYRWAPENVNATTIQGEGHAHLYVNGEKIARLYGDWFNLSDKYLEEGENVIEVTLNANDHSEWVQNGEHVADTVTITK